jgi:hypothetical protein
LGAMLLKHLEKRQRVLRLLELLSASEKTHLLVVKVVDFQKNNPIRNVGVKVFRLEKEPLTLKQWAENLKNGAGFKRLAFSTNTDGEGKVTAEIAEGSYEVIVEKYGLIKACELTQNTEVLFVEPKKHWWQ